MRGSDSYGRIIVPIYIEQVKGILTLSPRLLGVPTKILGAQSNPKINIQMKNMKAVKNHNQEFSYSFF